MNIYKCIDCGLEHHDKRTQQEIREEQGVCDFCHSDRLVKVGVD